MQELKKVLIIRCGALGDLVYATSVIDALKLEFGEDTIIDFVCTPGSGTLFNNDERVHRVFPLKHKKIPFILSQQKKEIVNYSQKNPYDILINFEYGKQFKSLVDKIQAKKKIGAIVEKIDEGASVNRGEQQKKFYESIISAENLKKANPKIAFLEFEHIQKKYALNDEYIVLAPSNSHVHKKGINYRAWQNQSWVELIARLSQEIQVVIVGAKGEESFFEQLQPYPSNVIDLVAQNNILELNSVINSAKAVVCTDSAVGHISAAVNTPVFVLMGPNNIINDSPYKTEENNIHVISLQLECSPCYKTQVMKACRKNICMEQISVDMVYQAIKKIDIL